MKTWKMLAALLVVSAAVFSCDSGGGSAGPPVLFSEDFSGYGVGDSVSNDWVYFD